MTSFLISLNPQVVTKTRKTHQLVMQKENDLW